MPLYIARREQYVQRILRLSGVVSGKRKMESTSSPLWRNETYIVGIVPQPMPLYTARREQDVQRILRLSGVVSGKRMMRNMSFSGNLIRCGR